MTTRHLLGPGMLLALASVVLANGCGSDSDVTVGTAPTATPTVATTPTRTLTPQAGANVLSGLVVVRDDVAPRAGELGVPPTHWGKPADEASFDRSFANADFTVNETGTSGTTAADGAFTIPGLAPGRYTIDLTKTVDGNLVPIAVPVVVGDRGETRVVIEVGMGLVRTTATYEQNGVAHTEVRAPNGTWMVRRGDRLLELGDTTRTLRDDDGDGRFDAGICPGVPTACTAPDRACPDGSKCQCVSSCPFCDNCVAGGVCAAAGTRSLYTCAPDGTCALPGDRCVDTCPECVEGGLKVCLPGCEPIAIVSLILSGPSQLVVGREAQLFATATLSDGTVIDVTYLAEWQSSDASVASVDSWGRVSALQTGATTLTVHLGDVTATASLEVVARPTLRQIVVQNTGCVCPALLGRPQEPGAFVPCYYGAPERPDILPFPSCSQTIVVGATLQFTALGEYADGTYEDLTDGVEWTVDPPAVGSILAGTFTGQAAGTAKVQASLGTVRSEPAEVRVVTEPTAQSLSIFPGNYAYDAVAGGPLPAGDVASPCFECTAAFTVLRNDTVRIQATAHYDTGEWRDVSDQVTWRSSDTSVASIDATGVMTALAAGTTTLDATLGTLTSNPLTAKVVETATVTSLSIYQEGTDRVVAKADQRFFHATAAYDIGIVRDVTDSATWRTSNAAVGGFDTPGVFTARGAGVVEVWAEVDGVRSPSLSLEVYETSELTYCDANDVNRSVWADDFNRVVLESDCKSYTQPGVVTLRYTVTETRPHGGIFDPCLDLYVYDGDQRVRTIREEGCGDPFLPNAAPGRDEAAVKYQLRAFWDMKDDRGEPVAPGTYAIYGRFYLYYDPVVSITVEVGGGSGTPRPTRPTTVPTPTPTPTVGPARIAYLSVGSAVGRPGEQVSFDVALKANGIPIAGVQHDVIFGGIAVDATDAGKPRCTVDPSSNKPDTSFKFLSYPDCQPESSCTGMRAIVLSFADVDPIPDGAVLYRCTATIPATAQSGTYGLTCENASASDPKGGSVGVRCASGVITVGDPSSSSIPAEDADGTCYVGAGDCTTNSFFPTAQERCCAMAERGGIGLALSWCEAGHRDAAGNCLACSHPCSGVVKSASR